MRVKSPSRREDHGDDLKPLDLLFALLLHLLVLTVIGTLIYWQNQHRTEPLKRIEVMMISARQLANLEQQSHRKANPVKKAAKKQVTKPKPEKPKVKPPKPKPVVKPKPEPKPKVAKPAAKPLPKPKPKPKKRAPAKADENFDPFAPLASTSDRSTKTKSASTSRPELANLVGKQLSTSEKERYIAMMQAAVQEHWKLPISSGNFTDPLVEMRLLPNGEVASVTILESSGNDTIDASLTRAIRAAAPFELPKQQFEFFRVNRIRFHPLK